MESKTFFVVTLLIHIPQIEKHNRLHKYIATMYDKI